MHSLRVWQRGYALWGCFFDRSLAEASSRAGWRGGNPD